MANKHCALIEDENHIIDSIDGVQVNQPAMSTTGTFVDWFVSLSASGDKLLTNIAGATSVSTIVMRRPNASTYSVVTRFWGNRPIWP